MDLGWQATHMRCRWYSQCIVPGRVGWPGGSGRRGDRGLPLGFCLWGPRGFRFPWQAAALFHASVCALAANYLYRKPELGGEKILATLRTLALLTSAAAVVMMIQAAKWEPSSMLSTRIFWLAGIWLLLLWV